MYKRALLPYKNQLTIIAHIIFITIVFFLLYCFDIIHILPNNLNVIEWDAKWYSSIVLTGYKYIAGKQCNLAFFPLFPYLWKFSHLPGLFICLLNACLFYIPFYLLIKDEKLPPVFTLFLLSIPSVVFFYVPYSEAIFFVFGVILLKGYQKGSLSLKVVGLLGMSLTRSVAIIFIPAILLTELLAYNKSENNNARWRHIAGSILSCLAGLMITAYIQWYQTGKWFYFLSTQKFWHRQWARPKLPLTTANPTIVLGIDAAACIIGGIAIFYCLKWVVALLNRLGKNSTTVSEANKAVYFSALYLSATVALDTLFTFMENGSTNIWSMNRHIFGTPFAFLFIIWLYKKVYARMEALAIGLFMLAGIFFTGVYHYHSMLVYYVLFCLSLTAFKYFPAIRNYLILAYVISILFQIRFLETFLSNVFIG